jgi:predicted amidophosphoribosyltransferase
VHTLAKALGVLAAVPVRRVLCNIGAQEQKSLTYAGRLREVSGRFRVNCHVEPKTDLMLVDDVFTTGATLSACARLLKESGARRVFALTFAIEP